MNRISNIIVFTLLITASASAQLCQGSLGDKVINITFGSGSNPGPSLSAATTNYRYVSNFCPNDGSYTVTNSTSACFGDSWYTLQSDHTGNANGYFMLVNASYEPSDFYVDTVRSLCQNTTFEFAAWIMNVLKPSSPCGANDIRPNITFQIETTDGAVVKNFNTGDIYVSASPTWKQYGFFFKTPAGINDVVIRMRNNAPGGCGNDIALDDITFRPCGPQVTAAIAGAGDNEIKNLCVGDMSTVKLTSNVSSGYSNPSYQWQVSTNGNNWTDIPGETSTSFVRTSTGSGSYKYRLAVAEAGNINSPKCRVLSNLLTVNVNDLPVTSASSNSPACEGTTLSLTAGGGTIYKWKGPNDFSGDGNPLNIDHVSLNAAGKYTVTVTSDAGCEQKDSATVSVLPKPTADAGADTDICEGDNAQLNGSGGLNYLWTPPETLSADNIPSPLASPIDSTVYVLTVSGDNACKDADTVIVNVYKKPSADAGPDKVMIEGQSVMLEGSAGGNGVSYQWTPAVYISDPANLSPTVNPPRDTIYTLHVISDFGCGVATDNVFVKVYKKVIVPNAFSPNGDGINDAWNIEALDSYPDADVSVFNRYGQLVFHSIGYNKKWDGGYNGNALPIGTYYYLIDLKNKIYPNLKGWVVILR